tara:strand:- start:1015 stop:1359 length:345 start_codon:yes stop_codon:yes gene_type:complete
MKHNKFDNESFDKKRKRHKNIQHNRDQLKLLKEKKINTAELFILDLGGFKKVTISPNLPESILSYKKIVYLSKKYGRLLTADIYGDQENRLANPSIYVEGKHIFGIVLKEELLK